MRPKGGRNKIRRGRKFPCASEHQWSDLTGIIELQEFPFWKEDFQNALKLCQKIKQQNYRTEPITLEEVRKFNINLLSDTNPKAQLYFWIGFLSYFKRSNLGDALQDFENFEKSANDKMNILKQKSTVYLREIKQKMEIK